MVTKLILMFVCGKVVLWRYIAVWLIAVSVPVKFNY